jgi:hypothetical protein
MNQFPMGPECPIRAFSIFSSFTDISPVLLLPTNHMSLLPAINYLRYLCYRRKMNRWCHGIEENPGQGLINRSNDTSNNLLPVSLTPTNSLLLVSTTPAVNTKL